MKKQLPRITTLILAMLAMLATAHSQITGSSSVCLNSSSYYDITNGNIGSWSVTGQHNFTQLPNGRLQVLWKSAGNFVISANYIGSNGQTGVYTLSVTVQLLPAPTILPMNSNLCSSLAPPQVRLIGGRDSRRPGELSAICYLVCDSGWYNFSVTGRPGSTFNWSTTGAASILPLNVAGDSVRVNWATAGYTDLTVTETDVNGCRNTDAICIQVMESPDACFGSAPLADANGVINLCLNATLSLNANCSTSPFGSNIVSRKFIWGDGAVTTNTAFAEHTYTQAGQYTAMLIVESNCSCKDTVYRTVNVSSSVGPDIFCVNSVCHDSVSIFSTSSTCSSLQWSVNGGTILTGSSSTNDSVFIQWGNGNTGYGTVSLVANCGGACPYPTQVFVPILPSNAIISGRSVVCNGSTEVYSVPYVPTTQYTWLQCTNPAIPSTCINVSTANSNSYTSTWATTGTVPTQITTLKVLYTNPFLGCSGSSTLPITIADDYNLVGDTVICSGLSATIQALRGTTKVYCNWDLHSYATGITSSVQNNDYQASLSGLSVGSYTLYATSVDPDWCGNPMSINIRVAALPPTPTASIAGPDTVCPGGLATYFTAAPPIGLYADWQAEGGSPASGAGESFSTIWSGTQPYSIKLRYVTTAEPGCPGPWLTKNIYPENVVLPSISGSTSVCGDDTATYTLNFDADDYQWEIIPPERGSVVSGQHTKAALIQWNYTATNQTGVQVKVTATKCGTDYTKILTLTIHASPSGTLTAATAPFCEGKSITFTASPASSTNAYTWSFGDNTTTDTTAATTTHSYGSDKTYNAKVTISNPAGCRNAVTVATAVDVLPGPAATLTTPDATNLCGIGWSLTLHTTLQNMNGSGFTYELYKNGSTTNTTNTSGSFTVSQTGSYTVMVKNTATGCEKQTNALTITANCGGGSGCTPAGTMTVAATATCGSVTATATPGSGVTFTTLNFLDPTGSGLVSSSNPATYTYAKAGLYRIEATGTDGASCAVQGFTTLTIPYVPDFTVQYACSSNVMQTKLIDLSTYTAGNSITGWQWIIDGNTSTPPTTQNPVLNLSAGNHTVQLKINNTCTTAVRTITVPAPAQASFTGADSLCETDAVKLSSTSAGEIVGYEWKQGATIFSTLNNVSKQISCTVNQTWQTSCISAVTLSISDVYGCTSSTTQNQLIYEDKFTDIEFYMLPATAIICRGQSVNLSIDPQQSPSTGPYSFLWSDGVSTNHSSFPATRQVSNSGEYTPTITDHLGCVNVVGKISAVLVEDINATLRGDTLYCRNELMNLSIFKGYNYTYAWDYAAPGTFNFQAFTGSLNNPSLFNLPMFSPLSGYWDGVRLRGSITSPNGCTAVTDTITLHSFTVATNPTSISLNPASFCAADLPITISATANDAAGFLWSNGVYGSSIVADAPGIYTLQKIDTNGCKTDSIRRIQVVSGPDFSQLITGCYTRCIGSNNVLLAPVAPLGSTYAYQWILNDSAVVSTLAHYDPPQSGTYRLVITETIAGFNAATIVCSDTSDPIYLTLVLCPNTWCAPEGIDTSCVGCHYDSLTNTRVMEFILKFYYTGNTSSAFNILCNTADVNAFNNRVGNTLQSIGHTIQHGWNSVRVEIWDSPPHQSAHELYIIIGNCQIPVTIQSPSPCH